MPRRLLARLTITLLLALGMAAGAHAQVRRADQTVLPIVDPDSGRVQAYLLLEPTTEGTRAGARWRTGELAAFRDADRRRVRRGEAFRRHLEVRDGLVELALLVAARGAWGTFVPGDPSSGMNQRLRILTSAVVP